MPTFRRFRNKIKIARFHHRSTDSDCIDVEDPTTATAESQSRDTRELLDLFAKLRGGGSDIVKYFDTLLPSERREILNTVKHDVEFRGGSVKPLFIRIVEFDTDSALKVELVRRYFAPGAAVEKNTQWLDSVLQIPFGKFAPRLKIRDLASAREVLDEAVYGHSEAKHKLTAYLAQLLRNQQSRGLILGLRSYPGVGKTSLVDEGVARILHRPFFASSLGGVHDSNFLRGFQYTYEGSEPGYIARCLTAAGIMNPVFFFDELDKVSHTAQGDEIVNTFIQLTDPIQSKTFHDRYLGGTVPLDLSACVFVFAYNDRSLINPILRDRITEIELQGFSPEDKLDIAREYIIPRILEDMGRSDLDDFPKIGNAALKVVIDTYTNEAGVRHLKRVLSELLMELNLQELQNRPSRPSTTQMPYTATSAMWSHVRRLSPLLDTPPINTVEVEDLAKLIRTYKPIVLEKASNELLLGQVNGLFVDGTGCSGILPLEAVWIPSSKRACFDMRYTGNLGKVMGESAHVAWSVAWNLLDAATQREWLQRWQSPLPDDVQELTTRGCLHVHCRDNATPKDGPSAGMALTVLMWSMLTDTPLPQDIAYTGEIGLQGALLPIGGLAEKLVGARRAGCRVVVIPVANTPDCKISTHDDEMEIVAFSSVTQVLALIKSRQTPQP